MRDIADFLGEFVDDIRVGNVFLLRGHGHHEMVLREPGDKIGIPLAEAMMQTEFTSIDGAQLGVITAAALGDVMEKAGQIELVKR